MLDHTPRLASGRARTECQLLSISHDTLDHLLQTSPSAARVMLTTIADRLGGNNLTLQQSEKMAQLGTLTAGIAHELNNPASAARRGAEHLETTIASVQGIYQQFHTVGFSDAHWQKTTELQEMVRLRASQPRILNSLERSDHEDEIETWLDEHQIENGWEYAPSLVNMGYQPANLRELEQDFSIPQMTLVVKWLCTLYTLYSVLDEIRQGTSRIGEIVKALKTYTHLDQASIQWIDVQESLENTLIILRGKLATGITLQRCYADELPRIMAYASELNQVWTNLIDNAVDAMDGQGTLTIRTDRMDDWVTVEIEDTGPGIPESMQVKLFSPFFTTKPVGKGTGLGLNISFNIVQKHMGDIQVFSQPGRTRFLVRLPVNFEDLAQGK